MKTDEAIDNIVMHVLADDEIKNTENYIKSGRRYGVLSLSELSDEYEKQYNVWSDNPHDHGIVQTVQDIISEYSLRRVAPPTDRIIEHHNKVMAYIIGYKNSLNTDQTNELASKIFDKYIDLIERNNKA